MYLRKNAKVMLLYIIGDTCLQFLKTELDISLNAAFIKLTYFHSLRQDLRRSIAKNRST